jgi:hypothetical protein
VGDAVQLNRAIEHRDLNAGWSFEERGRVKRLLGWRRNVADPVVQLRSGHKQLIYLALDGNRSARNDRMWHWRNAHEILIAHVRKGRPQVSVLQGIGVRQWGFWAIRGRHSSGILCLRSRACRCIVLLPAIGGDAALEFHHSPLSVLVVDLPHCKC